MYIGKKKGSKKVSRTLPKLVEELANEINKRALITRGGTRRRWDFGSHEKKAFNIEGGDKLG